MNNKLDIKKDERGKLIEIFKMPDCGQVYYLTVEPGFTRGNHYHKRKKEKFCVIEGEAKITIRKDDDIKEFSVSGSNPEVIDIPEKWIHNIKNISNKEVKMLAWISEVFNPNDPDTYYEK